jgi:ABC-type phosphate/phosphonate transport system substrate-binding protein
MMSAILLSRNVRRNVVQEQRTDTYVKIGAVAYAPKVVTIWEGMKEYLETQGLRMDFVLYSSYPALVEALVRGHIDIAWNTPLAYLQAKEKLGGQSRQWPRSRQGRYLSPV